MHIDFTRDAQGALTFLSSQAAHVETEVFRERVVGIQYPDLIDVDTSAGEYARSVEFASITGVGQAKWFNHLAKDVPNADVAVDRASHPIEMAAIGYRYTTEELGYAQRMGIRLDVERASAARRAYEEFLDTIVTVGDPAKGMKGLFNQTGVNVANVPNDGTGAARTFASKTPVQILRDLNEMLISGYSTTGRVEIANTVALPAAQFALIATTPMSADSAMTILDQFLKANVYTATTGQPVTVRAVNGLETAGVGGTARMMAYRKDRQVAKLHLPVPLRFLDPMRTGPMIFEVPGYFKTGGVEVRLPGAMRYRDGI